MYRRTDMCATQKSANAERVPSFACHLRVLLSTPSQAVAEAAAAAAAAAARPLTRFVGIAKLAAMHARTQKPHNMCATMRACELANIVCKHIIRARVLS